jgi:hypothetical protein
VLASVLAREPDWAQLPADAPEITSVVRRCLERDPKHRFGDMQSVRLALGGAFNVASASAPISAPRVRSAMLAWTMAAVATAAAMVFGLLDIRRPVPAPAVIRTMIPPRENAVFDPQSGPGRRRGAQTAAQLVKEPHKAQNVRLSPNQHRIVYQAALGDTTVAGIFVEAFPRGGKRQQVAVRGTLPVWSVDGKTLYYAEDTMLTVVDVTEADGALRFGPPRRVMSVLIGRG